MKAIKIFIFLTFIAFFTPLVYSQADEDDDTHWDYSWDYPEQDLWPQIMDTSTNPVPLNYPYGTCGLGKHQSPVEITGTARTRPTNTVRPRYTVDEPVFYNTGHSVAVEASPNYKGFVAIGNDRYTLDHYHFHSPSEHVLNQRTYEAEVHFVNLNRNGKAVVLAVFFTLGAPNRSFQDMLDNMPVIPKTKHEGTGVRINPMAFLPRNTNSYFTYAGSLTTPPCNEGINFYVFPQAITISSAQLASLKALYNNNVRHLQPLNGRVVTFR